MDIWKVLGILPTRDKNAIKAAYHEQLTINSVFVYIGNRIYTFDNISINCNFPIFNYINKFVTPLDFYLTFGFDLQV